ncbi:HypC/HybG/HupF family hydrogenase formation chaperone [Exilibacterium tricleocarpae]|uniref:HypC/HybG/HupF family hydrogenase formation chaperone n=1 Tax=Exilibacterium tricleocarpae TaxID=2591008 RepID=A0A545TFJ6_9GAMM|nr:HypC/HybG/HupF family hydrogenase formation chaperone [Exilibacterium tricleocarpae]TQV75978.1 HypC/HybG/HupF family hydrogenase formation chaperone [Exilibacterium tricleocarpae]
MCLGIPGRIVAITDADKLMARVDVAGVQREINIACVVDPGQAPDSIIGTWVLVHVGFAMSRIDEQEAQKTLQLLAELGEMQEELTAMQSTAQP